MFYILSQGILFRGVVLLRYIALPLAFLLFGIFSLSANAQNISANRQLTLSDAISFTLDQNPQLHQFRVKRDGLFGQRASSNLSPVLSLDVEVENFTGSGDFSGVNASETTISLSSVIELGSKRAQRTSVVDAQLDVLEYQRQAFTLDVLGELSILFVETLEIQELTALAIEARELTRNTLNIVEDRSNRGAAPEYEVKRAIAANAQAQLQVEALIKQSERNLIRLAAFWGDTSGRFQKLSGDLYSFGQQPEFSELYQRALDSPAIEMFASEARLKTAELQLAQTQSKPDISWQIGFRRIQETSDSAFTAGVSIPLFSGGRNNGAVATAMAARDEVAFRRKANSLQLHSRLFEAFSQREQYINSAEVFQTTIIPQLASALESTQQAYETGRYSYLDWIAAQKELLSAKQALIESAASASVNQVVIEQLTSEPLNETQF